MGFALKKSISKIDEYFKLFKERLKLINHVNGAQYQLKIIDEKTMQGSEQKIFTIQIAGKNLVTKFSTAEIIADNEIFEKFSSRDKEKILATPIVAPSQENLSHKENVVYPCRSALRLFEFPTVKIITKNYDRDKKEFIYTIEYVFKGETKFFSFSSAEILNNNNIFLRLSVKEAYVIGVNDGERNVWESLSQLANLQEK